MNPPSRSSSTVRSSSLTVGDWACAAILPLIAVVEALVFAASRCFEQRPPRLVRRPPPRLTLDDLAKLARDSRCFSVNEVEALHELYKKLSCSIVDDGLIHKEELQLALLWTSTSENLFLDRVFALFDEKSNDVIEFEEFVHALRVFHPYAPLDDKINFMFQLYDLRQTGYIEREEVKQMVIATLMESDMMLSDDLLEDMMDRTFAEVDADGDGKINKEEWKAFALHRPSVLKKMTVNYLRDTTTLFSSFIFNTEVEDSL